MDNTETKAISKLNDREKKQAALPISVFGIEMVKIFLRMTIWVNFYRVMTRSEIYSSCSGREVLFETVHGQGRGSDAAEGGIEDLRFGSFEAFRE